MFKFKTKQAIYDIGGVKVGGQPGELPTFLIGSIFWLGQKIVSDVDKGLFDAKEAEQIINKMQTQGDLTGVKFGFDIVGTSEEAFRKYLDFVAKHSDAPILLDAVGYEAHIGAARVAKQMGLQDRCIYNSIYKGINKAELSSLKESGIKTCIVIADNPKDNSAEGKVQIIDEVLTLSHKAGITKPLIDASIPAFTPEMGSAVRAMALIKEHFGHPVGLVSGNVATTMSWVKAKIAKEFRKGCLTATNSIMQTAGANWLMIGPAEQAEWIFPAVAVTDTYIATAASNLGTKPLDNSHPIHKIFL